MEDCILYCDRHLIPEGCENPERPTPLISERLLGTWEVHMADEYRHLAWSQEFRRRRRQEAERQRAEAEQRKAEATAARQVRTCPYSATTLFHCWCPKTLLRHQ